MINQVLHGDCLELMQGVPDNSIDLIIIDPPYNIGKAKWDKIDNYINLMGNIFSCCERVLKDTGSFYFFHNDFLQIVNLQNWLSQNSKFIFKQLIIWNKRFDGAKNKGFLDGFVETGQLRNYQKMVEYCLFYTFQDDTGLHKVKKDINNFKSLREYFKKMQEYISTPKSKIIKEVGQVADHCFRWGSSQWDLPTEHTYIDIINKFSLKSAKFIRTYESLRQEYESLRYTFNNQKTHHSAWNYEIAKKRGHITPKPVGIIENIIKHSSNENDLILDCFAGSGTTAIACIKTDRNYILMEQEQKYIDIINARIKEELSQGRLPLSDNVQSHDSVFDLFE